MASDLEKCAVTFFHAHKGFGVAIRPDGISVFLPGPVAGVYEKGDIRRAYIGERLPAPIGGDTVLCRTTPSYAVLNRIRGQTQSTLMRSRLRCGRC